MFEALACSDLTPASFHWMELSPGQKAVLATLRFDRSLERGGLEGWFFGLTGGWDSAVRDGLTRLGAFVTLRFFERASQAFPEDLPIDQEDRMDLLGRTTAEVFSVLSDIDRRFRETGRSDEDLRAMRLAYVDAHPEEFFS